MQQLKTEILKPIELPPLPPQPLFSVLIPNYNYANYIVETLDSILRQTYSHFEVIVCDDGSTDNSCDIISAYAQKDPRIKLIKQQNAKIAVALNNAYRESKGEIICILDADDVWLENKLLRVLEVFQSQPLCGFVIHNVIEVDGQGQPLKGRPMLSQLAKGWMGEFALNNGGFVDGIPPASALCLRREVTNLIFPLNPEMVRNTDSLIYRLAPLVTEIGAVPEVLSLFRLHNSNTTSATHVTPEVIERGQVSAKLVHQEQKKLLENMYGEVLAAKLTGQQCNIAWCHECYLLARLKNVPHLERKRVHKQLINHPHFNSMYPWYKPHRWLVQWDLPNVLFMLLFDQVYGSGRWKRLIKSWLQSKKSLSHVIS